MYHLYWPCPSIFCSWYSIIKLQTYHLYWPLLTNTSEDMELRVAALMTLALSQPTLARFHSLMLFMRQEQNPHLRHFWYTTLHSLAHTHYPCYSHLWVSYCRPPDMSVASHSVLGTPSSWYSVIKLQNNRNHMRDELQHVLPFCLIFNKSIGKSVICICYYK
jgi:hypothetical protein